MAQLRPKIVKLAKIIGGVTGITTKIDENAPEYYCMAGILSDDEADIAIAAGLRCFLPMQFHVLTKCRCRCSAQRRRA